MATQSKVTVYSTPTCHFCHAAKDFFTANNIKFTDYNVATDLAKRKEMIEKSGQMGVPVIDVDGELIVGFDENQLRSLLKL
ncbi:MAG: glutaredoxin domain-containing protein [bacterium]|nr:glutaredoxin domain-containing protein [bacterium]